MSALADFLLARIAEDEFEVMAMACQCGHRDGAIDYPMSYCPDRVLADCEAKRRRIGVLATWDALCPPDDWPEDDMSGAPLADAARQLLRIEALPYADHPDYFEEWGRSTLRDLDDVIAELGVDLGEE